MYVTFSTNKKKKNSKLLEIYFTVNITYKMFLELKIRMIHNRYKKQFKINVYETSEKCDVTNLFVFGT